MADVPISNLPSYTASSVTGTYFIINDSGNTVTYKATREQFVPFDFGSNNTIILQSGSTTIGTWFKSTGNLRIGTGSTDETSYKLLVDGSVKFRLGGPTFAVMNNGGSAALYGGYVDPASNPSNYFARADGANSVFKIPGSGGTMFFDAESGHKMALFDSGNFAIGTTTDNGNKLQVNGNTSLLTLLRVNSTDATSQSLIKLGYQEGNDRLFLGYLTSGNAISNNIQAAQMIVDDSGNINLISRSNYQSGIRFYSTLNTTSGYAEAMRITQSGNLLINTTTESPYDAKLRVNGNGHFDGFVVVNTTLYGSAVQVNGVIANTDNLIFYTTGGTQAMKIMASNGNVLIGGTSPNNSGAKLQVTGLAYVSDGIGINTGGSNWDYTTYKLYVSGNTKVTGFIDTNTIFSSTLNTLSISTLYPNTYLDFITWGGGNLLRLYDSGNLLIGSTTDNGTGAKLQVNGIGWFTSSVPGSGGVTVSSSANQPAIVFTNSVGAGKGSLIINGGSQELYNFISNVNGGNFNFYTNTSTLIAKLTSSGNLLLGTPNDGGYKLDVSGTSRFSNSMVVTGGTIQQGNPGGYTFTIDGGNGGGPRLGLGSSPSAGYDYFVMGAYNVENNFDTVGRNFVIRSTISSVNDVRFKLFSGTGNVLIQNGGTFTDNGYRLDVSGSTRISGSLSLGPNAIDVTTGYGNYISTVYYPITTSADGSTFWIRVINNGNSLQRIKLLLVGGSDNTLAYDEFEIAASGYNMPHNILRKPTTIYNTSKIVGILTSNPTGAQVEVWINVLGTTVSNGYFNIYSNVSLDTLANMQASKTTTKPTKANNGTELIINDYKRTNYTIQTSNGAEFNGPVTANQKLEVSGATSISTVETGLTPSNSSSVLLSLNSITQGFLMPRMTTTQINAISSPDTGLEVYNTTLQQPCFYDGTGWRKVSYSTM